MAAQLEALVLIRALLPDGFDEFLGQTEDRLADPVYVALQQRAWDARSWSTDDRRLHDLADDMAGNLLTGHLPGGASAAFRTRPDDAARLRLISSHREEELPAMARLTELVEARLRAAGLDLPPR